jgi:hypothetical protein
VTPWTREEIEAWVNKPTAIRPVREVIVREFPEAPDYDALVARLVAFRFLSVSRPAEDYVRDEIQRCRDFREHCAQALTPKAP